MRLRNYTDLPDATVRAMIAHAKPPGVAGFNVRISNAASWYRGRAYSQGSSYHDRACPFIVVSVAKRPTFPAREPSRGGYLPSPPMSRTEAVLFILAHELRHLWQARVPRGRRVWGARGKFSERDADAYALRALRHWRRGEPMPRFFSRPPVDTA